MTFLYVTPFRLVNSYRNFGGHYCLHFYATPEYGGSEESNIQQHRPEDIQSDFVYFGVIMHVCVRVCVCVCVCMCVCVCVCVCV